MYVWVQYQGIVPELIIIQNGYVCKILEIEL